MEASSCANPEGVPGNSACPDELDFLAMRNSLEVLHNESHIDKSVYEAKHKEINRQEVVHHCTREAHGCPGIQLDSTGLRFCPLPTSRTIGMMNNVIVKNIDNPDKTTFARVVGFARPATKNIVTAAEHEDIIP